jgi:hypothetical protein
MVIGLRRTETLKSAEPKNHRGRRRGRKLDTSKTTKIATQIQANQSPVLV